MIDAKVVDADTSGDTEDLKEALNKLEDFDFDNVLDKESDYAFVQEAIMCSHDNEVVLDLRDKDCIYNQRNIMI